MKLLDNSDKQTRKLGTDTNSSFTFDSFRLPNELSIATATQNRRRRDQMDGGCNVKVRPVPRRPAWSDYMSFPCNSFILWMLNVDSVTLTVHRVRKTALKLASQLSHRSPDILVVELTAIFHDLLDKKYRSQAQSEKDVCTYEFFLPFFRENAHYVDLVTSGQAALIAKIIDNVSWSTETELRKAGGLTDWHETCVELHCVQDADRLDAMGAIGMHTHHLRNSSSSNSVPGRNHEMCCFQLCQESVRPQHYPHYNVSS